MGREKGEGQDRGREFRGINYSVKNKPQVYNVQHEEDSKYLIIMINEV